MKHRINPQIDCVFKAILGSEKNKLLLIDFLNSILEPAQTIENVAILNPFSEKEFLSDKGTVVDIKAQGKDKRQYQIEIQIANHASLPERMLYTWSNIYHSQLQKGDNYDQLAPVISIWLLAENLFKDAEKYHHCFMFQDNANKRLLVKHSSVHVVELNKWRKPESLTHSDHWVYFFKEAQNWLKLPPDLNTPAMRQAMVTLQGYSEKELEYDRYRRRELFLHEQATWRKMQKETAKELEESQLQINENQLQLKENGLKLKENEHKLAENKLEMLESKKKVKDLELENERLRIMLEGVDIKPS